MADKDFGVKKINLIGASGIAKVTSPTTLNLNAPNVAISTDMSVGGDVGIGSASPIKKLDVRGRRLLVKESRKVILDLGVLIPIREPTSFLVL